MGKLVGIFGTSGMAREARDIANDLGLTAIFVARDKTELTAFGDVGETILESDISRFSDIPYVIGIGDGAIRRKIASRFSDSVKFGNLIHPTATFGRGQREKLDCQEGVIVSAGVRFTCGTFVGNFTIFNLNATVSHDCIIGDFVTISPQACVLGNVEVRRGALIGAGAVVNQGGNSSKLIIGENTIVGSGAVVLQSCSPNSTYVGIPARLI